METQKISQNFEFILIKIKVIVKILGKFARFREQWNFLIRVNFQKRKISIKNYRKSLSINCKFSLIFENFIKLLSSPEGSTPLNLYSAVPIWSLPEMYFRRTAKALNWLLIFVDVWMPFQSRIAERPVNSWESLKSLIIVYKWRLWSFVITIQLVK